jgi:hypothetical protein
MQQQRSWIGLNLFLSRDLIIENRMKEIISVSLPSSSSVKVTMGKTFVSDHNAQNIYKQCDVFAEQDILHILE